MSTVNKLKVLLLTVLIGETITLLTAAAMSYIVMGWFAIIIVGPTILLTGILIQLIIIFIKIKDSTTGKIIYTFTGFLLTISITAVGYEKLLNTISLLLYPRQL